MVDRDGYRVAYVAKFKKKRHIECIDIYRKKYILQTG